MTDLSSHHHYGTDQLERFCSFVLDHVELHEQLRAMADIDDFTALVIRMGRERGFSFAADDVRAAMRATWRAFNARSMIP